MVLDGQEFVECSVMEPVGLWIVFAGHIFDCILDLDIAVCKPVVDTAGHIVGLAVVAGRFVVHLHTLNLLQHHLREEWC